MKPLYEITYQITDRGIVYPEKTEEVIIETTHHEGISKLLNKYRFAHNLSKSFTFKIISAQFIGYSK